LVVIAASAGGLPALIEVLSPLPADFPAAIAIVQHRGPEEPERLLELLAAKTQLRVRHATDGAAFEPGTVYVCPPGMHMTTEHCVRLLDGPKLRSVQPNADLMFESVGRAYGERAIGVVLSGCGSDAARGSRAMAQTGGTVLAQSEDTCAFAGMPLAAVRTGAVERVLSPPEIAELLRSWQHGSAQRLGSIAPARSTLSPALRVLLADDHQIVLDGLRALLEAEPDIHVLATAGDGEDAVRLARELGPDVVVMDLRMPGLGGVEATRQIVTSRPEIKVVALTAESDARLVRDILDAGATGYVTKHLAFGELVQAIRTAVRGETYLNRVDSLAAEGVSSAARLGQFLYEAEFCPAPWRGGQTT
jgi:two-component system chemotaxis response regulator CheB